MSQIDPAVERAIPARITTLTGSNGFSGRFFLFLLAGAVVAVFPKVVLGIETFFDRDFGAICYAQSFYLRESLLRGEFPFWNPYNYCGVPFLAQWCGCLYPTSFLHAIFPAPWSMNFFHLMHLIWGGCGMYWLARRLGCAGLAASLAGFAYVFNGVTLSCLMWPSYTAFLAWSPWVFGCTIAAWQEGGRWIPLAAMVSAMQVLACAPELTVLFWMLLGFFWLSDVAKARVSFWPSFGRFSATVILAAGITMVQMLPFFDLLAHSQRDANYGGTKWAMPGWGWANLFVPIFHCFRVPRGSWYQPDQHLVSSYYVGAGMLALAAACVWLKRTRESAILGGMALFCWIMALGSDGFLFDWIKRVFPFIGIARYPVKFAFFPAFLVPLLAGWAVDEITERPGRKPARTLIPLASGVAFLVVAIVWFATKYPFPWDNRHATIANGVVRALFSILLLGGVFGLAKIQSRLARVGLQIGVLAIIVLDAFTHSPNLMPTLPASSLAPGMWEAGVKQPTPILGQGRAMTSQVAAAKLGYSHFSDGSIDFIGKRLGQIQDLNLLDRVPMVGGGLILRPRHFDKLEQFLYQTPGLRWNEGLLDFLSVQYISSPENPVLWAKRTNWLPVLTAGQRPAFATDDQALKSITAESFEPLRIVYLEPSVRSMVTVTNQTKCEILNTRFDARKISAEVEAAEPSLVVLSQSYYHLWRASVNGRPTPLLRANLAFQAVQVPAGRHLLAITYSDPSFRIGAVVSALAVAACLLFWFSSSPAALARLGSAAPGTGSQR